MDLTLLAGLVVGGVSLIALVTHLTGGTVTASIESSDEARRLWALDYRSTPVEVQLSDDHHAALLSFHDGSTGVLFALGDNVVARTLGASAVRRVHVRDDGLRIALSDFGAPTIRVTLRDGTVRASWQQRLES